MLHEFLRSKRGELLSRTSPKGSAPRDLTTPADASEGGIPLFLTQLAETLRLEGTATPFSPTAMGNGAANHGRELLASGYTVARVVDEYGAACQAIAELVAEEQATITPEELQTLTRCLQSAIAEAVTEYGRLKEEEAACRELARRAQLAHDLRNLVQTALLSFQVLQTGQTGSSGSAGRVLGRSLASIRDLTEGIVSGVYPTTAPREHDDAGEGVVAPSMSARR